MRQVNSALDCKRDWSINHTYFEKAIPEKTAMSENKKMAILSNDLVRRLSVIFWKKEEDSEKVKVVEHFMMQLKASGYGRRRTRDIVISGVLVWIRKRKRREECGQDFYRGAESTLKI